MSVLIISGCVAPHGEFLEPPEPGIIWPSPPDPPRVRFLGELRSVEDLHPTKSFGRITAELLEGPAEPVRLIEPHAVAVHRDGQRVAVSDPDGHCVHLFDLNKKNYHRFADLGPEVGSLDAPVAMCWVDEALWIADANLGRVVVFEDGENFKQVGTGHLHRPSGMTYCESSALIYVADAAAHVLSVFDRDGNYLRQLGSRGSGPGQFNFPTHLACEEDGTVVVADSLNFRIQRLSADGRALGAFGHKGDAAGDLALPKGVAVDQCGVIWIADAHFENVQAFSTDGRLMMAFGREGRGPGEFWLPAGLCIDRQNRMWVADRYNRRVQVFALMPHDEQE